MKTKAWDVYLHGKHIDTVFFDADCTRSYVYNSLVNHDGYSLFIKLIDTGILGG